jgi:hypothetical protein
MPGYLKQVNEEIYELTEEGFARADKETAIAPFELSLSFAGTPDKQMLSVQASKPITLMATRLPRFAAISQQLSGLLKHLVRYVGSLFVKNTTIGIATSLRTTAQNGYASAD